MYKRPPLKVAGEITLQSYNDAVRSIVKVCGYPWLENLAKKFPRQAEEFILNEVAKLAADRKQRVEREQELLRAERRKLGAMHAHWLGVFLVKCRGCKRRFYTERRMHFYCSPECRTKAYTRLRAELRRVRREQRCRQCHNQFTATRGDARYCGTACRLKHFRRMRKLGFVCVSR